MIFISYASDDTAFAHELYSHLKAVDLEPWMDKPPPPDQYRGIPIGRRWEAVLSERIRAADQIILVLSTISVAKRGYVSKEFRMALELMNYLPDDGTLIYPIRIDNCQVPSMRVGEIDLRDLQWWDVSFDGASEFTAALSDQLRSQQ